MKIRNNKKGGFNLIGMVIGWLSVGLLLSYFAWVVVIYEDDYDASDYNEEDLAQFNTGDNLTESIKEASEDIDITTSNPVWFDFLSGVFNVLTTPLKTMYRSFTLTRDAISSASQIFELPSFLTDYFITIITLIVMIGIVMFIVYMGRKSG